MLQPQSGKGSTLASPYRLSFAALRFATFRKSSAVASYHSRQLIRLRCTQTPALSAVVIQPHKSLIIANGQKSYGQGPICPRAV